MVIKTSPHLKYVATLPCNLSLMACFVHINVSQGSVAYLRYGGMQAALVILISSECKFNNESSGEFF